MVGLELFETNFRHLVLKVKVFEPPNDKGYSFLNIVDASTKGIEQ